MKSPPLFASLVGSCAISITAMANPPPPPSPVEAVWTSEPVSLDGRLDDPVWKRAPSYPLSLSKDKLDRGEKLQEPGRVQFAWDDKFFYAAFDFDDGDVVQESDSDHEHFYLTGDLAELFIKPRDEAWYWEFYATPNSLRTTFFYPGRGRLGLPSTINQQSRLKTAAQVDGTLNDWKDRDKGWTAEMAIPLAELAEAGLPLKPGTPWTVFVGRYNYGRYLSGKEMSMMPPQTESNYHLYEEWADLHLIGKPKD